MSALKLPPIEHYRPDIDGVRAIAVMSVVLGHAFPGALPGGFIGVDIFFVISGYLISSILIRELREDRFSLKLFYIRRIRRIFPVLIATLLFIGIAGWFCLYRPEFSRLGGHLVAGALFSENFQLSSESGYFDVRAVLKPTLHLWSLAIEEQFYVFWPLLLAFAYRRRIPLKLWFAALAAASFLMNLEAVRADPAAAYFSPFARAWELILGAMLAELSLDRPDILGERRNLGAGAGAALIVLALVVVRPNMRYPGLLALAPTLGAALLIAAGSRAWINRRCLASAPLVGCGLVSYSLYLWHWPLLSFAHILFGEISVGLAIGCVGASVLFALASYAFIEQPLRRPAQAPTRLLLGALAGVTVLGALALTSVLAPRLKSFDAPSQTEWDFLKARSADFNSNGTGVYALAPERPDKVLFIGDSHVAQYAARLDKVIASDAARPGAVLAVGGACVPIEGVTTSDPRRAACGPLLSAAWDMADSGKFGAIVVGAAWNWYFRYGDFWIETEGRKLALASPEGKRAALDWLAQRFRALQQSGRRVVFLLDGPESEDFDYAKWPVRWNASLTNFEPNRTARIDASEIELRSELLRWAHEIGVAVIDPFGAVCTGDVCEVTTATGQPIFKDTNHFNPAWLIAHAAFIDAAVPGAAPEASSATLPEEGRASGWELRGGFDH